MTRIRRYFDEVWSELRKVSWPTREHVRNLTVLVFAISLVVGIYIAVLDAHLPEPRRIDGGIGGR